MANALLVQSIPAVATRC